MNKDDFTEVLQLLQDYYDGLYRLDVELLRDVFSPTAHYATITDGSLLTLSIDEYYERLAKRPSPAGQGVDYAFRVLSIRFAGESTALAEIECSLFGHDYTDYLSLLRVDGRWRIQTKVFEGVPQLAREA
ncbi:MAG: nuclear transport factor 2 family protein [Phycisphaerales bacterium]|mgnify:CR=1 FL=1